MTAPTTQRTRTPADRIPAGRGASVWDDERKFYRPRFPSTEMLASATALFDRLPRWDGREGPVSVFQIAPGAVTLRRRNYGRRERTHARMQDRADKQLDAATIYADDQAEDDEGQRTIAAQLDDGTRPPSRREITCWSTKSRGNFFHVMHELDYAPLFRHGRVPAMVTLTWPDNWQELVPTGREAKKVLQRFRRFYERAWGEKLSAIWKQEFQRRGAPHFHLMMVPPHGRARAGRFRGLTFKAWLSAVWAYLVGAQGDDLDKHRRAGTAVDYAEGLKASDPRRVANYFMKHGAARAKEYQHIVPDEWRGPGDGPGRFWGYWRMARTVYGVETTPATHTALARTIRRWSRAQDVTHQVDAPRYKAGRLAPRDWQVIGLAGSQELAAQMPARARKLRRRVRRLRGGAGWVSINDGAAFASQLSRYLALVDPPGREVEDRRCLARTVGPPPAPPPRCRECGTELAAVLADVGYHVGCHPPGKIDRHHDHRPVLAHITSPKVAEQDQERGANP